MVLLVECVDDLIPWVCVLREGRKLVWTRVYNTAGGLTIASGLKMRPPVEFPTSTLMMAAEAEAARASAATEWKNISARRVLEKL